MDLLPKTKGRLHVCVSPFPPRFVLRPKSRAECSLYQFGFPISISVIFPPHCLSGLQEPEKAGNGLPLPYSKHYKCHKLPFLQSHPSSYLESTASQLYRAIPFKETHLTASDSEWSGAAYRAHSRMRIISPILSFFSGTFRK